MSTHRRARPGIRRDGQVRSIRSDEVRYPGHSLPLPDPLEYDEWKASGRHLRPARDTGLAIEGRLARERRQRETARRRNRTVATLAAVIGVSALIVGWRWASDRAAAEQPLNDSATTVTETPRRTSAPDPSVPQMRALSPSAEPTPIFARVKGLELRLPVRVEDLTEVGFHQASYSYALRMKSAMPAADMKAAKREKGTGRDIALQQKGADAELVGSALVMWRNRPGKPDTAVDVGARAGSPVLAPLTGTVVKVKRYSLYGKYDDFELHIQPDGKPGLDLVMIHISDLTVKPGDRVRGGVTPVGTVRKLSDRVNHQLGDYTRGGGDHTHIQLNDATHPDYKGLKGAISVDSGS